MDENDVARQIVDAAYKVHRALGPGLLESVYEIVLAKELEKRGLRVQRQVKINIRYEDSIFEAAFTADLIVEELVIVEIKSVEDLAAVHKKQLLTYLRLTQKRLGLLINFDEELIRNGIKRVANGLPEPEKHE